MTIFMTETIKKDKTREQLLETSSQVFSKYGYKKTTMDDIAEAVKKGKSSIYYYFKSKEEIFEAVVYKEAVNFRKAIIDAVDMRELPGDKLKAYITTRMNILKKYPNLHRTLKNEKLAHLKFVKRLNSIYDKEEIRLFRRILNEGSNKGYFQILDTEIASVAIVMAIKGIENLLLSKETKDYNNRIDDMINIIFYGIVKK